MKIRRSKKIMENYVCPKCWHQVHQCTCNLYPPWELIMIDVNIQDVIRTLNEKGYQTIACCESHFEDSFSVYVAFSRDFGLEIPDGFNYDKKRSIISYMFKKNERENKELFEHVKAEKLKVLSEWAQSLPENSNMFRR